MKRVDSRANILAVAGGIKDKDLRNRTVCALIGHSRLVRPVYDASTKNWHVGCGRCGTDVLHEARRKECVLIGAQPTRFSRELYARMTWRDKLYVPYPFNLSE